ncbi:MAG: hypothetical protein AB1454_07610 [Candidatus Auribacterota bacterium]|jgi:tetratricopeptide (TPR) repeat protein|uniref:Uncharacterized protein n=1 Tax=Candidatus Auribacter fodinae TaxID=2093366 RepID=A0A3A4R468_9BACT|nr:MAG: hypothetical protein C4541_06430 [Candidatus Auribacter fodinae]
MKKRVLFFVILLCVVLTGVTILVTHRVPFAPLTMETVFEQAYSSRKPLVVGVYSSHKQREMLRGLFAKKELDNDQETCMFRVLAVERLDENYRDMVDSEDPVLVMFTFRGDDAAIIEGIPDMLELRGLLNELYGRNAQSLRELEEEQKQFYTARKLFEEQKYIQAMKQIRSFLYIYGSSEYTEEARDLLSRISETDAVKHHIDETQAKNVRRALLHQAKENMLFRRYFQAERILASLINSYAGTDEAKKAEELKQEIDTVARDGFRDANELYRAGNYYEALEAFSALHEQFKGTHWDLYIAGKIKLIEADPRFAESREKDTVNRQAKLRFEKAEEFFKTGTYDVAKLYYIEIARFYPNSDYTKRAKQRLAEIEEILYQKLYGPEKENDSEQ